MGRNALWLLGSRIAADLLSFVLFLVVSRQFGPEGAGVYAYGFAIAGLVYYATTLGIDEYGIREYTRQPRERHSQLISDLLGSQVWIAAIALVLLAVYLLLTQPTRPSLAIVLTLTVYQLASALSNTYFVPAMAEQQMRIPAVASMSCRALAAVVALACVLSGVPLAPSMFVFAVAGVCMLVISTVSARRFGVRGRPNLSGGVLRDGVRALWSFAAVDVMAQLFTRIGVIVLALRVGEAAAGIYATGLKLVEAAVLPMLFGGLAAYPRLCRAFRDPIEFDRMSRTTLAWGIGTTLFCALAMFFAVPWLVVPLLGPRYAGTEPILATMAALVVAQGIEIVLGRLLLAANLNVMRAAWVTIAGIVCVLATLVTVPSHAIVGAIASVVAAYVLLDVLYAYGVFTVRRRTAVSDSGSVEAGRAGP